MRSLITTMGLCVRWCCAWNVPWEQIERTRLFMWSQDLFLRSHQQSVWFDWSNVFIFSKYTFEALSRRDYGNSGCQQNMQKQGILFFPSNRFVRFLFLICFELARKHARQCVSLHLCVCVQHESKLCFDETNDPFFCVFTHQQVANAFHIWTFHFFYSLQSVFFHITPFNLNAYNHRLLRIRCLISNFVSALFF